MCTHTKRWKKEGGSIFVCQRNSRTHSPALESLAESFLQLRLIRPRESTMARIATIITRSSLATRNPRRRAISRDFDLYIAPPSRLAAPRERLLVPRPCCALPCRDAPRRAAPHRTASTSRSVLRRAARVPSHIRFGRSLA